MKKIYIHTDMEGLSGVGKGEMIPTESADYAYCVKRLMADVNAAVDGAFLGGAGHVTVLDSHGGGGNFDLSLLDKRAENDTKPNKKWWGILDGSYDGTFFIGAHAMAGTMNGFLDHTQSSEAIYNYYINGRKAGELAQWAIVAAHHNVPVIMVSGDEAAVNEASQFFGDIELAAVKRGLSRFTARLLPNDEAEERIRAAAMRAVQKTTPVPCFRPKLPMEIKIEFNRSDYCDYCVQNNDKTERIDARSMRKMADSYQDFWY
jgi:D-amino peptidase